MRINLAPRNVLDWFLAMKSTMVPLHKHEDKGEMKINPIAKLLQPIAKLSHFILWPHPRINRRRLLSFDNKLVSSHNLNAMEKVISFLKRLHPVSGPLEAELRNGLHFTKKAKNEFLLFEGEICRYAWYLQKGLVRCYYNRDEREVTTWFIEEDNVIVLFKSLFGQRKSLYNVEAIEDCELYGIRIEDILHLVDTYPEVPRIRTIIAERFNNLKDIRARAISGLSPNDRYLYFKKHFPQLLNRIKLEHIASYLDISKSSLARARRR